MSPFVGAPNNTVLITFITMDPCFRRTPKIFAFRTVAAGPPVKGGNVGRVFSRSDYDMDGTLDPEPGPAFLHGENSTKKISKQNHLEQECG